METVENLHFLSFLATLAFFLRASTGPALAVCLADVQRRTATYARYVKEVFRVVEPERNSVVRLKVSRAFQSPNLGLFVGKNWSKTKFIALQSDF